MLEPSRRLISWSTCDILEVSHGPYEAGTSSRKSKSESTKLFRQRGKESAWPKGQALGCSVVHLKLGGHWFISGCPITFDIVNNLSVHPPVFTNPCLSIAFFKTLTRLTKAPVASGIFGFSDAQLRVTN